MTSHPKPGDCFADKYVIESLLGTGSAGVVVSATHTDLRRRVAIKVLRSSDPIASERMFREARATIALHSEHVVRVMDVGRDESGHPFIVMEELTGADLASLLQTRGRFAIAEAVDAVLQACAGIAEAHASGIIHRDLKPSNLFLTRRADGGPLVKVLDFGISKVTRDAEATEKTGELTGPAELLGSPMYMSPEQVRGASDVDARTDIWSLGVILYRLISARPPFGFGAPTISAALAAVVADAPTSLRELVPDVPPELEAVVHRCLSKDPANRFASIEELVTPLAPFGTDDGRAAVARLVRVPPLSARSTDVPLSHSVVSQVDGTHEHAPRRRTLYTAAVIVLLAVPGVVLALHALRHHAEEPAHANPPEPVASAPPSNTSTSTPLDIAPATSSVHVTSSLPSPIAAPRSPRPARRPTMPTSVVRSAATDERY